MLIIMIIIVGEGHCNEITLMMMMIIVQLAGPASLPRSMAYSIVLFLYN